MFDGNGDNRNCSIYRVVKLCEHGIKVVKSLYRIVTVNEIEFGFISEKGIIDTVFTMRWLYM